MFSGIIQATAPILSADKHGECRVVRIQKPRGWKLADGQSVAIDGICSTVTKHAAGFFEVEYMSETLGKTTAGAFAEKRMVNLERSLTLNSFVDGHLVQGHIDARGRIKRIVDAEHTRLLTIALPLRLMKCVALHGSIAVNGVSLTVARLHQSSFAIALIPHTLANTNLGVIAKGDKVNVETDMIARYLDALRSKKI